jgi:hypothetical protein
LFEAEVYSLLSRLRLVAIEKADLIELPSIGQIFMEEEYGNRN